MRNPIAEFLRARLAEAEAAADADAFPPPGYYDKGAEGQARMSRGVRALADVESKRAILDMGGELEASSELYTALWMWEWIIRLLAETYDDHPDYDKAWRPVTTYQPEARQ